MLNRYLIQIITEYVGYIDNTEFDIEFNKLDENQIFSLIENEDIPESFYLKHEKTFEYYIKKYLNHFMKKKNIPFDFLKRNLNKDLLIQIVDIPTIPHTFYDHFVNDFRGNEWYYLIENNKVIPFWWYEKHIDKILKHLMEFQAFNILIKYQNVNEKFIEKYCLDPEIFIIGQKLLNIYNFDIRFI